MNESPENKERFAINIPLQLIIIRNSHSLPYAKVLAVVNNSPELYCNRIGLLDKSRALFAGNYNISKVFVPRSTSPLKPKLRISVGYFRRRGSAVKRHIQSVETSANSRNFITPKLTYELARNGFLSSLFRREGRNFSWIWNVGKYIG